MSGSRENEKVLWRRWCSVQLCSCVSWKQQHTRSVRM